MKPKASSEDAMYAAWQNEADANGNEALEEVEEMGEGEGEEEEEMEDDQNAEWTGLCYGCGLIGNNLC